MLHKYTYICTFLCSSACFVSTFVACCTNARGCWTAILLQIYNFLLFILLFVCCGINSDTTYWRLTKSTTRLCCTKVYVHTHTYKHVALKYYWVLVDILVTATDTIKAVVFLLQPSQGYCRFIWSPSSGGGFLILLNFFVFCAFIWALTLNSQGSGMPY